MMQTRKSSRARSLLGLLLAPLLLAAAAEPDPMPTVMLGDRNGDGRYTGADVELALAACAPQCTVHALAFTFDDVQVILPKTITGRVVIRGSGMGETVFRAPIPQRAPVFNVKHDHLHVTFRDLTIDGRKGEQTTARRGRFKSGISVENYPWLRQGGGLVERVHVRDMMETGIGVAHGENWEVSHVRIEDMGCSERLPCPKLTDRSTAAVRSGQPGWKTVGMGVVFTNAPASHGWVHDSTVRRVVKIGIEAFKGADDFTFTDNRVEEAGGGIVSNGSARGRIERNTVLDTQGHGISCGGDVDELSVVGNVVKRSGLHGIEFKCRGSRSHLADNTVEDNCQRAIGAKYPSGAGIAITRNPKHDRGEQLRVYGNRVSEPHCESAMVLVGHDDAQLHSNRLRLGKRYGLLAHRLARTRFAENDLEGGTWWHGVNLLQDVSGFDVRGGRIEGYGRSGRAVFVSDPKTVTGVVVDAR